MAAQAYTFGPFRIDAESRILFRGSERVPLPPKTLDLLIVLLEAHGSLVDKDELLRRVWPDTFVEEGNLSKNIFYLRKTLGNDEKGQPYIETIPKRGYRFIGDIKQVSNSRVTYEEGTREQITIEDIDSDTRSFSYWWVAAAAVVVCIAAFVWQRGVLAARQPRSILVLPFASAGEADELLRFGFTQDLAARLRTVRGVRVITPITDAGADDLTNKTAVDTILTGRLTGAGSQIRVAAELRSAKDGSVLWAQEASNATGDDFQSAQRMLASSLASRLRGQLIPAQKTVLERGGSTSSEAYEAFLRGRGQLTRLANPCVETGRIKQGLKHVEIAVKLDPGFADAWAQLAVGFHMEFLCGLAPRAHLQTALENAQRALSIDPDNILARSALIKIYHSTGQNEDGLREAKRALELNNSDPEAQAAAALAYFRTGMLDRAIDMYERYLAIQPDDEVAMYNLVHACLFANQYDRGIRHAQPLVATQRLLFPTYLLYANSGDYANAVSLARQSLARHEEALTNSYFGALVLKGAGLEDEARSEWLTSVSRLKAKLELADNERTRMFLAMMLAQINQPAEAREQVQRAFALNPGDPWILFFASETYALLADRDAALNALRRSVAGGFLGLHYLDYYQKPLYGWHRYRDDPEFRAIRDGLARKIADLRARY